jgi:hypothetical protein
MTVTSPRSRPVTMNTFDIRFAASMAINFALGSLK